MDSVNQRKQSHRARYRDVGSTTVEGPSWLDPGTKEIHLVGLPAHQTKQPEVRAGIPHRAVTRKCFHQRARTSTGDCS
jgi:hypothetical protein